MRIVNFILFFAILYSFEIYVVRTGESDEFIGTIQEILSSESLSQVSYVNILSTKEYFIQSKDFLSELVKVLSESRAVMLITDDFMKTLSKKRIPLNLLILQSRKDFMKIIASFSASKFNYGGFYILFFQFATEQDVLEIFNQFWSSYIYNVNFIRQVNESIRVETFFPFNPQKCNTTDTSVIAEYENGKFITKPTDFFPQKFKNFFNCSLKLVTFESLAPSVLKRNFINGTFELYGRDIEMMKMLRSELNFYANVTFLHEYGSWGALYPNGTTTGGMGRATRRETDLTWGNLNLKLDRTLIMDFSFGYYLETLIFVIPKGEPFSPFMKLLRPFNKYVWIALTLVIVICILVIVIVSNKSERVRSFVYGEKIEGPFLNVLIAVYGGSQHVLPSFNFARSLLMMFLLFCLVFRSLYQGSLYQFLQSSDNKPEVSTIEEMSENDFKFYMITSYDDMTSDNLAMKNKRIIIQPSELLKIMDNTIDVTFKGTLLVALSEILYKNKLKAQNLKQLYTVCKQPFTMIPISIYYPKNSYLQKPVDEKLIWYQCSGLMSYWASHEMDFKYLSYKSSLKGPKAMSLNNFSGTFQLWLISCIISISVFFVEIFLKWNYKKGRYAYVVKRK